MGDEEDFDEAEEEILPHRESKTVYILGIPVFRTVVEISRIPRDQKEDEELDPLTILDKQTNGLEHILNEIQTGNIKPIRTNNAEQITEISQHDLLEILRLTHKQIVALRGNTTDYYTLAQLETTVAKYAPKEKAKQHYKTAREYMELIKEGIQSTHWNEIMATLAYRQFELDDEPTEKIQEAFKYAINADTPSSPETANALGKIYITIARERIEDKMEIYQLGIKYLTAAVATDRTPEHLRDLGLAQAEYAKDILGQIERDEILKSALETLEESYKLKKDPTVQGQIDAIKKEI